MTTTDSWEYQEHDGLCPCGTVRPCEEPNCRERPFHAYPCVACLAAERRTPDPDYLWSERLHDKADLG
jgi:hypothetical protein